MQDNKCITANELRCHPQGTGIDAYLSFYSPLDGDPYYRTIFRENENGESRIILSSLDEVKIFTPPFVSSISLGTLKHGERYNLRIEVNSRSYDQIVYFNSGYVLIENGSASSISKTIWEKNNGIGIISSIGNSDVYDVNQERWGSIAEYNFYSPQYDILNVNGDNYALMIKILMHET